MVAYDVDLSGQQKILKDEINITLLISFIAKENGWYLVHIKDGPSNGYRMWQAKCPSRWCSENLTLKDDLDYFWPTAFAVQWDKKDAFGPIGCGLCGENFPDKLHEKAKFIEDMDNL